jgi:predicted PurR-regulated permease PerM
MTDDERREGDTVFLRRLLLGILVLGVTWLFWQLRFVMVLAFGAILFAVILDSGRRVLEERLHVPHKLSLTAAILLIIGSLGATFALFGAEVAGQAKAISAALPAALEQGEKLAAGLGVEGWVERWVAEFTKGSGMSGNIGNILMSVGDGLTNLIILLVGGVFLASKPHLYRTGLIKLVPPSSRPNAATALNDCQKALQLWLKGRLLAMALVGLLTGAGLWLIGVPSYLALALLAALLEFVPFFGPLIAAVPAVLLALLGSPSDALMVAALFLVIQQLEGNLISPIIQQHAVELPPALLLFALLAFGLLFGLVGVVLAEPLTVAIFVLIKRLYVREALGTNTPMPGENSK